jgi:long-chain acyl-CoA synthetase
MLVGQFKETVRRCPDRIAIVFSGQTYSYAALGEAVERLIGALAERGIARGDRVALLLPNCPHFVISHLAILGLGAVVVPIHAQSRAREIAWPLEDGEARAIIAWSHLAGEVEKAAAQSESLRVRAYVGDDIPAGAENLVDMISQGQPLSVREPTLPEDLAAIMYTSGTSGRPRGVELTYANFSGHCQALTGLLRIRETDRFLALTPFSSASGMVAGIHLPLLNGAQVEIQSRFHPGDALKSLHDNQTTVVIGNPSAYALMAGFPSPEKYDLKQLRYALSCEARLSETTARDVEEKLRIRLMEAYGTTETCGMITVNLFPGLLPRGSVGQPVTGHEIQILDEAGELVPVGSTGAVAVRGPSVMRCYRNRPDKTRQAFRDGWFLTGDEGSLDDQSNLFITGHSSELIVKGGFTVCCREVEEVVEGLPHVQEVAVVGIPDPLYGEEIKACVVLKDGASIGPSEVIEYVKERIAFYKCPKVVKLYKELPRTPGGKIIRSQLKEEKL